MITDEDKRAELLILQLEEWRRKYDAIDRAYDRIRSRSITLLTIQIAVVGYLITQLNVLIKAEMYGRVFFVIGALLLVYSVYLAIKNYRAHNGWSSPMYDLEIEKMNNADTYSEAVAVLVEDYHGSYDHNFEIHQPAAKRLNDSLFIFIASAIILLVLNFIR